MTEQVTLEIICGRCDQWLVRWRLDADQGFDAQEPITPEVPSFDVLRSQGLGGYLLATDRHWYRWNPDPLPHREVRERLRLSCPNGCASDPQATSDKFHDAVDKVLRHLHDTRSPVFRITLNKLLRCYM